MSDDQILDDLYDALKTAANMLGSVAGDLEDGHALGDIRGKYVLCLLGARDRAHAAAKKAAALRDSIREGRK